MRGERLREAKLDERGVEGDRLYAVRDPDGKFGSGKHTRRFRRMDGLNRFGAEYVAEVPVLTLPDGVTVRGDDDAVHGLLAEHLARPSVTLVKEASIPHHDEAAVHLVTTSTLAWLRERAPGVTVDERRLRPNILVDTGSAPGLAEEAWIGQVVRIGDVELEILRPAVRCVMVDLPYAGLAAAPGLFKIIATHNDRRLGVHARVVRGGTVRVGDRVGR
ncbi:MOSC domain-containing protein [Amycolatopsis samaneae]